MLFLEHLPYYVELQRGMIINELVSAINSKQNISGSTKAWN